MSRNKSVVLSFFHRLTCMTVALGLNGCNRDLSDVQQYVAEIASRPRQPVKPLPEFKSIETFIIEKEDGMRDPFKLVEKIKAVEEEEKSDNGIRPDTSRKKEPLESFSLSSLKMVGTINMNSVLWGLIKNDNIIHRVKMGEHLGKNDGKIISIDQNKIELIEVIPSKSGRFIEQSAVLILAE